MVAGRGSVAGAICVPCLVGARSARKILYVRKENLIRLLEALQYAGERLWKGVASLAPCSPLCRCSRAVDAVVCSVFLEAVCVCVLFYRRAGALCILPVDRNSRKCNETFKHVMSSKLRPCFVPGCTTATSLVQQRHCCSDHRRMLSQGGVVS